MHGAFRIVVRRAAAVVLSVTLFGIESRGIGGEPNRPDTCAHDASRLLPIACYVDNMTPDQWEQVMRETELLPPAMLNDNGEPRFFVSSICWTADGSQGSTGMAAPASLTYSFPDNGTTWGFSGLFTGSGPAPNTLNTSLTNLYGAGNLDRGREYFRQCLAGWRRTAGLSYQEVADDNSAEDQNTTRVSTRGDIRIGGFAMGTSLGILAYNAFPNAAGTGLGGGDMNINTSYFSGSFFNSSTNNYRYLRNTVSHEHGHGLSYIHVTPCNSTKLMEPQISTPFDQQTIDELRGVQRNYGDRFAGNNSAANARNFGNLTTPSLRSVLERNLSTNGVAGANGSSADWFAFTIDSDQNVTINANPTGGSYANGQQTSGCNPTNPGTINASAAGNLTLELRDASGVNVLSSSSGAAGSGRTLNIAPLVAGTYIVRVVDVGPNSNQTLQLYDLTIRVASSLAPPAPIAGLNKRVAANTNCFFMGDINSRANETGATLPTSGYDWDLDGDGTFEVNDQPAPNRQYSSNGVYPVTLRLTDSNGQTATDTITVTVFGGTTTITSVVANNGQQGQVVPVVISGNNLKNVTSASHVTVSGTGVTVIGTPTPNVLGTQVTGLSFDISPLAPVGLRNVTVSNADGTGTGNNLFDVTPGATVGDMNCDGVVDLLDLPPFVDALIDPATYTANYPACFITRADTNNDTQMDGLDIKDMIDLLLP
jgi:hypothetical protein